MLELAIDIEFCVCTEHIVNTDTNTFNKFLKNILWIFRNILNILSISTLCMLQIYMQQSLSLHSSTKAELFS